MIGCLTETTTCVVAKPLVSINVLNVKGTKFSLRGDMIEGVVYQQSLILDPLHFPLIYNNLTKMIFTSGFATTKL